MVGGTLEFNYSLGATLMASYWGPVVGTDCKVCYNTNEHQHSYLENGSLGIIYWEIYGDRKPMPVRVDLNSP